MLYLVWVFKDKSSWAVFIALFLLTLYGFKVLPGSSEGENLTSVQLLLGVIYALLFALIGTCLFKTLKEKIKETFRERRVLSFWGESKKHLLEGDIGKAAKSFLKGSMKLVILLAGILGLGAAQFCAFGSPVCGFSVGAAVVTALFPSFLVQWLYEYAQYIVIGAIVLQLVGLYFMGCFRRVVVLENNRGKG